MAKRTVSVLRMTCIAAVCAGMAWAQDAPPPVINLPPVPHSQRASGAAMIRRRRRLTGLWWTILSGRRTTSELLAHCTAWKCACSSGGEANLLFPSD